MSVLINASTSTGLVQSADTSGEIELQSNGTTALKVNTNEGIQILNCLGVGNATPSTSGAGITFPATQSASTDANTLDDYEEGTWSPNVGGSATYNGSTYGIYTKVGNVVTVQFRIDIASIGSGSTGQLRGLPFTSAGVAVQSGCIGYFAAITASITSLSFYVESNATTTQFTGLATASSTTGNGFAVFGNGTIIHGSVTYRVA